MGLNNASRFFIKDWLGLQTFASAQNLPPGWLFDSSNVVITNDGSAACLRSPGTFNTALATTNPVLSVFNYDKQGGPLFLFDITTGGANSTTTYKTSGTSNTSVRTGQANARWNRANVNNWAYGLNGVEFVSTNGTNTYAVGVTPPAAAPTISYVAGGTGAYTVGVSLSYAYRNSTTLEVSAPTSVSNTLGASGASKKVRVPVIASSQTGVDGIVFFLTVDGGSVRYLVIDSTGAVQIAANTSTNVDLDIGTILWDTLTPETSFNTVPPQTANFLFKYKNRLLILDFRSATTRGLIQYSAFESVYYGIPWSCFPALNAISLPNKGDSARGGCESPLGAFILGEADSYLIRGTLTDKVSGPQAGISVTESIQALGWAIGSRSPLTLKTTPFGLMWLDQNKRLQLWSYTGTPQEAGLPIRDKLAAILDTDAARVMAEAEWYSHGKDAGAYVLTAPASITSAIPALAERWHYENAGATSVFSTPIVTSTFIKSGVDQGACTIFTSEDGSCYVYRMNAGTVVWSKASGAMCYGRAQAVVLQGETDHTVFFPSHDGKIYSQNGDGTDRWTVSNLYVREGDYGGSGLTPVAAIGPTDTVTVTGKAWDANAFIRSHTVSGANASVQIISGLGSGSTLYEIKEVKPADHSKLTLFNSTFPTVDATSRIVIVPKYSSDVYWQHAGTLVVEGGVDYLIACGFDDSVTKIRCTDGVVTAYYCSLENNEAWPLVQDVGKGHVSVVFGSIDRSVYCLKLSDMTLEWQTTLTDGVDSIITCAALDNVTTQVVVTSRDNKVHYLKGTDGTVLFSGADLGGDIDSGACLLQQGDGTYKVFVAGDSGKVTMYDDQANVLWQNNVGTIFNSTGVAYDVNFDSVNEIVVGDESGNIYIYNQSGALLKSYSAYGPIEGVPALGTFLSNGRVQLLVPTLVDGTGRFGRLTCYEFAITASQVVQNNKQFIVTVYRDPEDNSLKFACAVSDFAAQSLAVLNVAGRKRLLLGMTDALYEIFDLDVAGVGWATGQSRYFRTMIGNEGEWNYYHSLRFSATSVAGLTVSISNVVDTDGTITLTDTINLTPVQDQPGGDYYCLIDDYGARKAISFSFSSSDTKKRIIQNLRVASSPKKRLL